MGLVGSWTLERWESRIGDELNSKFRSLQQRHVVRVNAQGSLSVVSVDTGGDRLAARPQQIGIDRNFAGDLLDQPKHGDGDHC